MYYPVLPSATIRDEHEQVERFRNVHIQWFSDTAEGSVTSTVNAMTVATISSRLYDSISISISGIVLLLLTLLLIQKELVRARGGAGTMEWLRVLDTAIIPLLIAMSSIVFVRILELMR